LGVNDNEFRKRSDRVLLLFYCMGTSRGEPSPTRVRPWRGMSQKGLRPAFGRLLGSRPRHPTSIPVTTGNSPLYLSSLFLSHCWEFKSHTQRTNPYIESTVDFKVNFPLLVSRLPPQSQAERSTTHYKQNPRFGDAIPVLGVKPKREW